MSRSRIRRDCKSLLEEYKSGPSPGNFAVSWKVTFFAANELNEDELLSNLLVLQRLSREWYLWQTLNDSRFTLIWGRRNAFFCRFEVHLLSCRLGRFRDFVIVFLCCPYE